MGRYPSRVSVAESMLRTVVSVLLLGGVAVVVLRVAGVQRWWGPAPALLRAGVQLAALSLVLAGIITNPWWVSGALAVMFFAAVTVSTRRAGGAAVGRLANGRSPGVGGQCGGGSGVLLRGGGAHPAVRPGSGSDGGGERHDRGDVGRATVCSGSAGPVAGG